ESPLGPALRRGWQFQAVLPLSPAVHHAVQEGRAERNATAEPPEARSEGSAGIGRCLMFYPLFIRVNGRTTIAPIDVPVPSEGRAPWSGEDLPAAGHTLLRDRVARLALRVLLCAVFRIEMTGLERMPRGRPAIYVANHLSWLDPFLLLLLAPL